MAIVGRLHHVNVAVTDIDAAERFYGGLLGLPVLDARPDFGIGGQWYDLGQGQLHLIELPDAQPVDLNHFALEVDDLDAAVALLVDAGVSVDLPGHIPGAGRQAFLRDPTGNLIELNQPDR